MTSDKADVALSFIVDNFYIIEDNTNVKPDDYMLRVINSLLFTTRSSKFSNLIRIQLFFM